MGLLHLLILLCCLFFSSATTSLSQKCNEADISTLLDFTNSFELICEVYPKTLSWNKSVLEAAYWDGVGVQCDQTTGHVIGIDLSSSCLYGPINSNTTIFSSLVHLQYLNLADNFFSYSSIPSELGNLSRLAYLDLSYSGFAGTIPLEISKLSELSSLDLSFNNLQGAFPISIFHLPKLQLLRIQENNALQGYLPDFNSSSHLETLELYETEFVGKIPSSIGNIVSLKKLDLSFCKFLGTLPSSLGNLTQLIYLHLAENNFAASNTLPWLSKLNKLKYLYLFDINLEGEIPSSLANLTQLSVLYLYSNTLNGVIPSWLGNLTQLSDLNLSNNSLSGSIPNTLLNMPNITSLVFDDNLLSGPLEIDLFFQLEHLTVLSFFNNNLTIISRASESNFKQYSLFELDISYNKLQGFVPVPPPSVKVYAATGIESITGLMLELPPTICSLSSLTLLNFRDSHLTGELPRCFGNLSKKLQVLDLQNNSLHGSIPEFCSSGKNMFLSKISFNRNSFEGQLPRSLASCSKLKFLDVGNNFINDTFPSWLGSLPHLRILLLKANAFYGSIGRPDNNAKFPGLRIIDLSMNKFSGNLPWRYFQGFDSMKSANISSSSDTDRIEWPHFLGSYMYSYSVTIADKGMELEYWISSDALIAIDLSHNRFHGKIPRILGNLRGLHLLNLSYNHLTGPIPSSLAELKELQSLDLSSNRLSGDIPQQLSQMTSVSSFNVSYNNLSGLIPEGRQFNTFEDNSYLGNPGLCGKPLSRSCGNSATEDHAQPPAVTEMEKQDNKLLLNTDQMVAVIGFVGGLVFGVAMENAFDLRTLILSWIWKLLWRLRN